MLSHLLSEIIIFYQCVNDLWIKCMLFRLVHQISITTRDRLACPSLYDSMEGIEFVNWGMHKRIGAPNVLHVKLITYKFSAWPTISIFPITHTEQAFLLGDEPHWYCSYESYIRYQVSHRCMPPSDVFQYDYHLSNYRHIFPLWIPLLRAIPVSNWTAHHSYCETCPCVYHRL